MESMLPNSLDLKGPPRSSSNHSYSKETFDIVVVVVVVDVVLVDDVHKVRYRCVCSSVSWV